MKMNWIKADDGNLYNLGKFMKIEKLSPYKGKFELCFHTSLDWERDKPIIKTFESEEERESFCEKIVVK